MQQHLDEGRMDRAVEASVQVLETCRECYGPQHDRYAAALQRVAQVQASAGRRNNAKALQAKSLAIVEALHGEGSSRAALSRGQLGLLSQAEGKFTEAEPALLRAAEVAAETLGPTHPDVARSYANISHMYEEAGNLQLAADFLRKSLDASDASLGHDHILTQQRRNALGLLYKRIPGHADKSEEMLTTQLKVAERTGSSDLPICCNNLATFLHSQGRNEEAVPLLTRAVRIVRKRIKERSKKGVHGSGAGGLMITRAAVKAAVDDTADSPEAKEDEAELRNFEANLDAVRDALGISLSPVPTDSDESDRDDDGPQDKVSLLRKRIRQVRAAQASALDARARTLTSGTGAGVEPKTVLAAAEEGHSAKQERHKEQAKMLKELRKDTRLRDRFDRYFKAFQIVDADGSDSLDERELLMAVMDADKLRGITQAVPKLSAVLHDKQKWFKAFMRFQADTRSGERLVYFRDWCRFVMELESLKKRRTFVAGATPIASAGEHQVIDATVKQLELMHKLHKNVRRNWRKAKVKLRALGGFIRPAEHDEESDEDEQLGDDEAHLGHEGQHDHHHHHHIDNDGPSRDGGAGGANSSNGGDHGPHQEQAAHGGAGRTSTGATSATSPKTPFDAASPSSSQRRLSAALRATTRTSPMRFLPPSRTKSANSKAKHSPVTMTWHPKRMDQTTLLDFNDFVAGLMPKTLKSELVKTKTAKQGRKQPRSSPVDTGVAVAGGVRHDEDTTRHQQAPIIPKAISFSDDVKSSPPAHHDVGSPQAAKSTRTSVDRAVAMTFNEDKRGPGESSESAIQELEAAIASGHTSSAVKGNSQKASRSAENAPTNVSSPASGDQASGGGNDWKLPPAAEPELLSREREVAQDDLEWATHAPLCLVCQTEPRCVVILPCAHLAVCLNCTFKDLATCPICDGDVEQLVEAHATPATIAEAGADES